MPTVRPFTILPVSTANPVNFRSLESVADWLADHSYRPGDVLPTVLKWNGSFNHRFPEKVVESALWDALARERSVHDVIWDEEHHRDVQGWKERLDAALGDG